MTATSGVLITGTVVGWWTGRALGPLFALDLVVGVLGWLLFDESVTAWTVTGAAIIFASNGYIAQREARLSRRAVTDPDINPETQQL